MASVKRRPLIAGNWKMNRGGAAGCTLADEIARGCANVSGTDIVVSPPFTALAAAAAVCADVPGNRVEIAGQNLNSKDEGAFTGEISPSMLLEAGCKWVIIGHSERRQLFAETDAQVADKVQAALAAGLRPIVCVGETLEERDGGKTLEVVGRQIAAFVEHLSPRPGFSAIAYEPVWAIGTGRVATTHQAQEVHEAIRIQLDVVNKELATATPVLYGGSVKPDNAAGLLACPDIDGALVGGASLDAASFLAIVRAAPVIA